MKKAITSILTIVLLIQTAGFLVMPAFAQETGGQITPDGATGTIGICTFIGPICTALGITGSTDAAGQTAINLTTTRISQVVSLIFIGIIILSVFIIIQAGVKYIQSQGDEGKIGEAQKAIKNVFIGIAVLFVGVIGIILVLAFFNGTGLLGSNVSIDQIFNPPVPPANP